MIKVIKQISRFSFKRLVRKRVRQRIEVQCKGSNDTLHPQQRLLLKICRPCYHFWKTNQGPYLCPQRVLSIGEPCDGSEELVPHSVAKVDDSTFLQSCSASLYLHVDIMNLMSDGGSQSFADVQHAVQTMRRSCSHLTVVTGLLFRLQNYYLFKWFGRLHEMWTALDKVIEMLEMLAIYDNTRLSDLVSAEVTMTLGYWAEGKSEPLQALKHLFQTLTHYRSCRFHSGVCQWWNQLVQDSTLSSRSIESSRCSNDCSNDTSSHPRSPWRCQPSLSSCMGCNFSLLVTGEIAPAAMLYHFCHARFEDGMRKDNFARDWSSCLSNQVGCRVMLFLSRSDLHSLEPFMWFSPYLSRFDIS